MNERINKLFSKACWDKQAELDIEDFIDVKKFADLLLQDVIAEFNKHILVVRAIPEVQAKYGIGASVAKVADSTTWIEPWRNLPNNAS